MLIYHHVNNPGLKNMNLMEAEQKIKEILQALENSTDQSVEDITIRLTEVTNYADPANYPRATRVYTRKVEITTRAHYLWEHGPA